MILEQRKPEAYHLLLKTPASWYGDRAKDSLPCGNGLTGLLCAGSIEKEQMLLTRHNLWHHVGRDILPDISETLQKAREAIDRRDWKTGNEIACKTLSETGYKGTLGTPCPLGGLTLKLYQSSPFSHYRRSLWMETGEVKLEWKQGEASFSRRQFVSRDCDLVVVEQTATVPVLSGRVKLDLYEDGTPYARKKQQEVGETRKVWTEENRIFYRARNDDGLWFGAVLDVDCDRPLLAENGCLNFEKASRLLLRCACFSGEQDLDAALEEAVRRLSCKPSQYEALLSPHAALHQPLFFSARLTLQDDLQKEEKSNEELLLSAYEEKADNRLLEKLWMFGRYLFISGAAEQSNPFPLYGLWCSGYNMPWCQNVANENVEMIYWHQPVGGLAQLVKPLVDYYISQMEDSRENARKLFGCRGIYVTTYTCPGCGLSTLNVPVILNWISVAGWLSRHFVAYCKATQDWETLREKVLPFMRETALFYEDYACYETDGSMKLYPSVSPENSPGNFIPKEFSEHMGHVMPSVINATMDFAIMKDLLTHLIALSKQEGMYQEERGRWEDMLKAIPDYQVNRDGAVKEWMHPELEDFYRHRHLSHLYPVFPGDEVTQQSRPDLWNAFEKAVELRELGGQSGWSMAHMASIYARFGRGEQAVECLDLLCRACLTNSFFTLHNDWREMGLSLTIEDMHARQLDANMGIVNALQEMLFFAGDGLVKLLPACPQRFGKGSVQDFCGCGVKFSFTWDLESKRVEGTAVAEQDTQFALLPPAFASRMILSGDVDGQGRDGTLSLKKGQRVSFICKG